MAFVVAALVMGAIGVFESLRHWLLYTNLATAMGIDWSWGNYLERGEAGLRAQGSTGQPIALGFVMAVAFGFFFYLRKLVPNTMVWHLGLAALVAGLIAPFSRGPWVGAAAMLLVLVATGPFPVKRLIQVGLVSLIAFAVLLATPFGKEIIALVPFVGTDTGDSAANVTYRQRLLEIGVGVILKSPFFGAYDFFMSAEAQELKQGNGMIDLVNTYLAVGLGSGLTGLSLFAGFFISIAVGIFKGMRTLANRNSELHLLGRVLLSVLIGILIIIFTVSSVLVIPVIYWSVAGLGVAYSRLLTPARVPAKVPKRHLVFRPQIDA
jgi:O-antigen ligase